MRSGLARAGAGVLVLGLAIAATFQPQSSHADAARVPVPAYVAPPGNADLSIQVLRADGEFLPGSVKFHLAASNGMTADAVAEPRHHHLAQFHGVPLGLVRLEIAAEGFAAADLRFLLEHPDSQTRLTIYLRTESEGQLGGGGRFPVLSANSSAHLTKILDYLRRDDLDKSRQQFRKMPAAELGDSNLQYLAGILEYRSNMTGMALFHFSLAAYLNPEAPDASRALAAIFYRAGLYAPAFDEFSRLARKHPEDWALAWQAASAAVLSAQYLQARAAAAAVVARSSDPAVTASAVALLRVIDSAGAAGTDPHHAWPPARAETGIFPAADFDPLVPPRLWAPPDVDAALPNMVQSAPCSAAEVLRLAGRRVLARMDQLGEVAAKDHIERASMGLTGRVSPLGNLTVDYMPNVLLQPDGSYIVEEFLGGVIPEPSPGSAVAEGRASLAQVFEPAMQRDFTFQCEGLTLWHGRPAWSVHFTQRKDRPARLSAYSHSGRFFPAYIRGRALVDQASGEILHMETDLENPILELRIDEEHLVIDYTPVKFQSADVPYYLPAVAELYVNVRGRLYRIREEFREYVRFAVSTRQEIKQPAGQE